MKVYVILRGYTHDPSADDDILGVVSSEDVARREVDRLKSEDDGGYYFVYEEAVLDGCLKDKEEG